MDFSYWDLKDKFTLTEIAMLWAEQAPDYIFDSSHLKGLAADIFDVLIESLEKRELILNSDSTIGRNELINWAKKQCKQKRLPVPKFLFYKTREELIEEEVPAKEATKIAQQNYSRSEDDSEKRSEFAGVVKALLIFCPEKCKDAKGKITSESVYNVINDMVYPLWKKNKLPLKEQLAKAIISKILKEG